MRQLQILVKRLTLWQMLDQDDAVQAKRFGPEGSDY